MTLGVPPILARAPEGSVEVERSADQGEVRKRLGEIAQSLATVTRLLGIKSEMVGVPEHLFKHESGIVEPGAIVAPRPGQGLDEPEGADIKSPLFSPQAVGGIFHVEIGRASCRERV